jgi:hypothetical protein
MITLQEIFDRAVLGVITQGKPSVTKGFTGTSCMYRGAAGTKCAVGHLIDDANYTLELEGEGSDSYLVRQALEQSLGELPENSTGLLVRLQFAHDSASEFSDFISRFVARARQIATNYNLTFPELPNASN